MGHLNFVSTKKNVGLKRSNGGIHENPDRTLRRTVMIGPRMLWKKKGQFEKNVWIVSVEK